MKNIIIAGLLVSGIFVYMVNYTEVLTFSNFFGWLAFSVATGSMVFFAIFAPYGLRTHTTVFGRKQKYRSPLPEIPVKVSGLNLISVIVCCATSFGFYTNGK